MNTNRLHFQIIFLIFTLFIDFEFLWSWKEIKIVKLYGNLYSINTLFLCKPKKIKRFRSQPNLPLIRKCRDIFEWLEQITVVLRFLKILSVKKTFCYFFLSFLSPFNILRNLQEKQSVKIINFWTIACLSPKTSTSQYTNMQNIGKRSYLRTILAMLLKVISALVGTCQVGWNIIGWVTKLIKRKC